MITREDFVDQNQAVSPSGCWGPVSPQGHVEWRLRKSRWSLLQFSAFTLQTRGTGVRTGECLWQKTIQLEPRETFQASPPSWHSSGLKEAPGQKWPKTGTNCLNVARRRHSLPGPTLFCPHLTSWFWCEGWRIIDQQRCCLHVEPHQDVGATQAQYMVVFIHVYALGVLFL